MDIKIWTEKANWEKSGNREYFGCWIDEHDSKRISFKYKDFFDNNTKNEKFSEYSFLYEDIKIMSPNFFSFVIFELFLINRKQDENMMLDIKNRYLELEDKKNKNDIYLQKSLIEKRIIKINKFNVLFFMNENLSSFIFRLTTYFKEFKYNLIFWKYIFFNIKIDVALVIAQQLIKEDFLISDKIKKGRGSETFFVQGIKFNFFKKTINNKVFIISEFNDENDNINSKIKKKLEDNGINAIVMNIDHKYGNIDIAIKMHIKDSSFIIANLSYSNNWNPNVFYELGIANGLNKNIIMFIKEDQFNDNNINNELPFDINSHTCLKWNKDDENGNKIINEILIIIKK